MFWSLLIFVLVSFAVGIGCQIAVLVSSRGKIYSDVEKIPHRKVGLLLGAPPKGRSGHPNQFFYRRIDAAVKLYQAGKIDCFILSGDKHGDDYDEPQAMRSELLYRGLPDSVLILDGEGYRTINSVVRAKETFKVDTLTIISQQFHNERSIFLAKHLGVDAIAYDADNTSSHKWKLIMIVREFFARIKAFTEVIIVRDS